MTRPRGLLPICASCKRIRAGKGDWQQVDFTHGLCPDCTPQMYPDGPPLFSVE